MSTDFGDGRCAHCGSPVVRAALEGQYENPSLCKSGCDVNGLGARTRLEKMHVYRSKQSTLVLTGQNGIGCKER